MIALYNSIHDTTPTSTNIADYINAVKTGTTKQAVLAYQNATKLNKQQRTELKNTIPCVTISDCNGKHSNYITIDFDTHIERAILIADKYSHVVAKSVGGINNFCIVKIDGSKHTESFNQLQDYYYHTYGALINQGCIEVGFKRFISYDVDIHTNGKATVFKTKAFKPNRIKAYNVILSNTDFCELINTLATNPQPLQPHIATFGYALANTYAELGRAYFNILFDNNTAYTYYLRTCDGIITLGALYHVCREMGVKLHSVAVSTAIQSNVVKPEVSGTNLDIVVKFLNEKNNLAYNLITMQVEDRNVIVNGLPLILQDNDYNTMWLALGQHNKDAKITFEFFMKVIFSNYIYAYNPILEFFETNKNYKRDGTTIQQLADSIETTTDNHAIFIKHWIVGLISGALYKASPLMLILAGEKQNTGKTQWFRNLLPLALQPLYAESKLDSTKAGDDEVLMCKKLIILDDEMSGTSKKENKRLKALMSKYTFSVRVPYGRVHKDMRRISTQCATTNDKEILSDPTGNRRLIPIHVLSIYFDIYNAIDKTALLMDAYDLYQSGWKWELSSKEIELLNNSTEEFQATNYERELIMACFELPNGSLLTEYLTNTQIKTHIENTTNQRVFDVRKLGMELKILGFEQKTMRINGFPAKTYVLKKVTEINTFSQTENNEQPF